MIATGGLAYEVSLLNKLSLNIEKLGPWIAFIVIQRPVYRNQGFRENYCLEGNRNCMLEILMFEKYLFYIPSLLNHFIKDQVGNQY